MSDNIDYSKMNFDPMTGERLRPLPEEKTPMADHGAEAAEIREASEVRVEAAEIREASEVRVEAAEIQEASEARAEAAEIQQMSEARMEASESRYFDRVEVQNESVERETESKWADVYGQADGKKKKRAKPESKRKVTGQRRGGGFFKRAVCATLLAVIFGAVAGGTFYGVCSLTGVWEKNEAADSGTVQEKDTQQLPAKQNDVAKEKTEAEVKLVNSDKIQVVSTDVSEMVEEVIPAMVTILNTGKEEYDFWGRPYTPRSSGTGVIIGENDTELLIVTNNHVAEGSKQLTITFIDDSTAIARIKGTDVDMDLAVLAVSLKDLSDETKNGIAVARLGDSDSLKLGQPAIVIGNALGIGISVTGGYISGLNREMTTEDGNTGTFIQTDAAVNHGNSGGALLNVKGEVVGIVSNKIDDASVEGMGYAIPISAASPIIAELQNIIIRTELVPEEEQGYLGVRFQSVSKEAREIYGMPDGALIYYIYEKGAAAKAGLLKRDVITKLENQKITDNAEAREILQYYRVGEEVQITYYRLENGEYVEHETTLVLGSAAELDE